MAHYLLDTLAQRSSDFRTISKRLDQFWRRDFSAMADIIKDLFPNSYDRRVQRDIPLVERVAKEQAVFYRRKPTRVFRTTEGEAMGDGAQAALGRVYAALGVDEMMKELNERAIVQRTVIGVILPRPGDEQRRLAIKLFSPWECEVDPDPVSNQSISSAREFRFRFPMSASHDRISFGTLKINAREAVYQVNGKRTGVFNEEGTNPLPGYPIFVARFGPANPGDFFASLPTDLLDANVSANLALSDLDYVSRYSSHGQWVLKNADLSHARDLRFGPDTVVGLMDEQELSAVSAGNSTADYLASVEAHLTMFGKMNALPPIFQKGWQTGASKAIDLHDRDSYRQDHRLALEAAENSFIRALLMVMNHNAGEERWARTVVDVTHHEPPMRADPLARAQSRRVLMEDGITSPTEVISQDRMVSPEAAREIMLANLEEYRAVRDALAAEEEGGG